MKTASVENTEKDWEALLSYLPEAYQELVWQYGVLRSEWPNAKVTDARTLLRFILLHVGAGLPLRQTVAVVAAGGGPKMTQVWLHKRMRRAQPYLAALVSLMLPKGESEATPERWAGYEMVCLDGSTVSGPGADGADVRMHAVVRLHDLRVCNVQVTTTAVGETLRNLTWLPGQLVIADRCYSSPPGILWVAVDCGADVLVRVNRGALPLYDENGDVIDILEWCRSLKGSRATERAVSIVAGAGKNRRDLEGRLIGYRLPEAQARDARARVRREEGPSVAPEHLEAAEYIILFTTAQVARLSAHRCVEAYRLRWQVELLFKRWKSLCRFDRLPNYRDDTMCAWLTAKVLLGLLLDKATAASEAAISAPSTRSPMARQPWKLTSIMWPLIVAALIPIRFADAADHVPAITEHLDSFADYEDLRQVDAFRKRYYPSPVAPIY